MVNTENTCSPTKGSYVCRTSLFCQMAKLIKTEVEESSGDPKSTDIEKPTTPTTNCSLLLYNNQHTFSPLCWPSIIQSANPVHPHNGPQNAIIIQSSNPIHSHYGPQNGIIFPTNISISPNAELDLSQQQQENPIIVNGPRAPLYIVSCPWFFSVPDHGNGTHLHPSSGMKHMQDGTSVNNQCSSSSSSKAATLVENQLSSLPKKVKSETAGSTEVRIINDLNETPVGFPPDGGDQGAGPHHEETAFSPVSFSSVISAVAIKNENGPQLEFVSHTDGISTKRRQLITALPGKNSFKFPNNKLVDAAAAAEARRRRKELTKLKNLHSRHCKMSG